MAVIIPPDHFQLSILFASTMWDSGAGACVLGFRDDSENIPSASAANALAAVIEHLMPLTTDTVRITGARWAGPTLGGILLADETGGLTSTVSTPNTAMLLRKETPFRGPRGRGRSYWPQMVSETEVDEAGVIQSGRLAAINSAITDCVVDWGADDLVQVVLQGDGGDSPPYDPPPVVSGFFCDSKVATQRRRMRR